MTPEIGPSADLRRSRRIMRIGIALPQVGAQATPHTLIQAACRAETLGYDTLWVLERQLYPVQPRQPYGGTGDVPLPEQSRHVFAPLETLAFVAAHTNHIGLGTSVLDMPFHNPLILARQLATLDVLSAGRLRVGLGLGWMDEEFEAIGASLKDRGRRADEFIRVLKAVWGEDPVAFNGEHFKIAPSLISPKPVQRPHPPIYLAAFAPSAIRRVGRLADGWNPVAMPADVMGQTIDTIRAAARAAGRDPDRLEMVVRANLLVTEEPLGAGRAIFSGSLDEIEHDVRAVHAIGATELLFDPNFSPDSTTADGYFRHLDRMAPFTKRVTGGLARTA
jgi:probable F420-dependent oxidoreductase